MKLGHLVLLACVSTLLILILLFVGTLLALVWAEDRLEKSLQGSVVTTTRMVSPAFSPDDKLDCDETRGEPSTPGSPSPLH